MKKPLTRTQRDFLERWEREMASGRYGAANSIAKERGIHISAVQAMLRRLWAKGYVGKSNGRYHPLNEPPTIVPLVELAESMHTKEVWQSFGGRCVELLDALYESSDGVTKIAIRSVLETMPGLIARHSEALGVSK